MTIELHAYTAEGVLTGLAAADGRLSDLLTSSGAIAVEQAVLVPLSGPVQRPDGWVSIDVDDLLAVVAPPETVTPYHAVWHRLTVDLGPYRLRGELPALPGFDPGRALARPGGPFILVGHAVLEARDEHQRGAITPHGYVWLNRYAVEGVASDLDLGYFFPGASSEAAHRAMAV